MPSRAKGERLARVIVFLLVASVLVFSFPPIARADTSAINQAQDDLQALRQLVDKLDSDLSAADEDYNQAAERLKQIQAAQTKTRSELAQAKKDLDAAQQQLMGRLVEIYKGGSSDMLDVLLGATDFSELVSRFEQLGRIGEQDQALIAQVDGYVTQVANRQSELAKQEKDEKTKAAQLADAEKKVAERLAAQTKALQGKEVQLAQLKKEEQARQVALAAAAKQAAAKAAAEAAQQAAAAKQAAADKAARDLAARQATTTTDRAGTPVTPRHTTSTTPATSPPETPPDNSGDSGSTPATDSGDNSGSTASETRAKVVDIALSYLGVPYVWAGSSPNGFDCSGFVEYVFAKVGVNLPHSSAMQYQTGTHVSKSDLQPGDLVFFYSPIHHVGIYIGNGNMVNSRGGGVQIDSAFWSSYVGATRVLE
jgi:peptidoglycan DL-endopeptidase CwlO